MRFLCAVVFLFLGWRSVDARFAVMVLCVCVALVLFIVTCGCFSFILSATSSSRRRYPLGHARSSFRRVAALPFRVARSRDFFWDLGFFEIRDFLVIFLRFFRRVDDIFLCPTPRLLLKNCCPKSNGMQFYIVSSRYSRWLIIIEFRDFKTFQR